MKLENYIRKISSFVAGVAVYMMVAAFYLGAKGFEVDENNNIVFMRQAHATEQAKTQEPKEIPLNFAFPQDHVMGDKNAPVTIYEYSSFGCSHCADFHLDILPKIKEQYVDKNLVRVVFVPLPIDKNSMDAALLAECVAEDKYFAFADVLYKKQRDWSLAFDPRKVLIQYAAFSGVGNDKANACLHNDINAAQILKDRKDALEILGIEGTPSFVVSSKNKNELVAGFKGFDSFAEIIEKHLPKENPDNAKANSK